MAKVIRNRWVYRPNNRWHRYLPRRNDAVKEFDYAGSMEAFKHEISKEEKLVAAPKLWLGWLYRDVGGEPKWTKNRVHKLFGADFKVGRMEVFANTAATNDELWQILKHLIELRPITFPNGEPSHSDLYGVKLHPDGRCEMVPEAERVDADELKLYDESKQWSAKALSQRLDARYYGLKDVNETNVYTPSNISVVR